MRYHSLLPVALSLSVAACTDQQTIPTAPLDVSAPSAAAAPATRTEFRGVINFCESASPDRLIVTPGGTLHLSGLGNRTQWVTGNPLIDGFEENAVLVNVNLKNGTGAAHLDVSLKPEAVNGTWEVRQTVTISGGAPTGSFGVGHGTGELLGMTIEFTTEPAGAVENVCNPEMGGAGVQGVIISPAISG